MEIKEEKKKKERVRRRGTQPSLGFKPAYGIEELAKVGPFGRSFLFNAIKEGKLVAQKAGRLTIITHENYQAFLKSLPVVGDDNRTDTAA